MTVQAPITVTEYTDPGCVFSWASEPQLRSLRLRFGTLVSWRQVLGLQIEDARAENADFDPEADAPEYLRRWTRAARSTGAPITDRLSWVHHSTGPACRAVISAREQGAVVASRVLRRLREAVFLLGRPADTPERTAEALEGVAGLDLDRLLVGMESRDTHTILRTEAAEARRVHPATDRAAQDGTTPHPGHPVPDGAARRYAFPTLVYSSGDRTIVLPGFRDAGDHEAALVSLRPGIEEEASPLPDADILIEEHATLTGAEVELLAGGRPPANSLRFRTPGGDLWRLPAPAPDVENPVPRGALS